MTTGYYNGGSDGGLTTAMVELSRRLEAARAAHVEEQRSEAVSPVVRALLGAPGEAVARR